MGVAIASAATHTGLQKTTSQTKSFTTINCANGFVILVFTTGHAAAGVNGTPTWNGSNMTLAITQSSGPGAAIYYAADSVARTANAVVNSFDAGIPKGFGIFQVSGMKGIGNTQGLWVSSTSISVTCTGVVAGDMTVDGMQKTTGGSDTGGDNAASVGANQTLQTSAAHGSDPFSWCGVSTQVTTDGIMSWSFSPSMSAGMAAVNLQGVIAGPQSVWMWIQKQQKFLRDLKAGLIPPNVLRRRYQELVAI